MPFFSAPNLNAISLNGVKNAKQMTLGRAAFPELLLVTIMLGYSNEHITERPSVFLPKLEENDIVAGRPLVTLHLDSRVELPWDIDLPPGWLTIPTRPPSEPQKEEVR